jgi:hypothetical protein
MKNNFIKVFARFYRVSAKSHLVLNTELVEALVGLMLGDLHAEKKNLNSNTRLQFKQSDKNKDYIDHLYNLFKEFCGSAPKITTWFDNRPNRNKLYGSIKFSTFSLPCFNMFRDMFYDLSGVKFIPDNLEEFLTARSLAYWLMDDGYQSVVGFYFCTDSYSLEDIHKLANILRKKFDLECGVHKHTNGHRLYIFSSSKGKLLQLIKPYLLPHFYYKFNLEVNDGINSIG